jgi:hypothetical protein
LLFFYVKEKLKSWIDDFLDRISPKEIEEPDEIVELEEISDMIYDFVVRNQEIFSRIKVKDGYKRSEGVAEES